MYDRAKEPGCWHTYGLDDHGFVSLEVEASTIWDYQHPGGAQLSHLSARGRCVWEPRGPYRSARYGPEHQLSAPVSMDWIASGAKDAQWAVRPPSVPKRQQPAELVDPEFKWIPYGDQWMFVAGYTSGGVPSGYVEGVDAAYVENDFGSLRMETAAEVTGTPCRHLSVHPD